ncbi:MAG TPA: response regulator transcription factor [Anaerolineales bacterium]|nr:response regulator transcription factor [Anaerolineales bacterium]
MPTRILLADDHGILRAGLRNLLNAEPDFEVVGEAADGIQALEMTEQTHPDLILMDINMPNMGGIEMLQQLRAKQNASKVLMLTVHEDDGLLKKAIRAGASGYLVKRAAESELINAIRTVMQGDMYVHPSMTRALLKDLVPAPPSKPAGDNTLTHREVEILRMVARGYTNNQIAEKLSISARTVEGHRANLTGKLGLHSRVELVEYAEQHGLMD